MEAKLEQSLEKKSENQNLPAQVQVTQSDSSFSVAGFDHAQRVAKMLSSSNLIPEAYRGNIQNTMIAMEMANRIGASPLMVMQNLYIVQGKPSWSSSFIIASLNACKRFSPLRFVMDGEGEEYGCTAWAYDLATNDRLEGPKVTWAMAKAEGWLSKAGSKWKTMPELMFRYRAAAFFGRLYAPDILMGMQTAEEVFDVEAPMAPSPVDYDELKLLFDMKAESLNDEDKANAVRILENKEVASYSKLFKLLQSK